MIPPLLYKLIILAAVLVALLAALHFFAGKQKFSWTGKILGFVVGFLVAQGLGALIGLLFGHIFDLMTQPKKKPKVQTTQRSAHHKPAPPIASSSTSYTIYFDTLFSMLGHFDQAGGEVTTADLNRLHTIMRRMELEENTQRNAWDWYQYGHHKGFSLSQALFAFSRHCRNEPLLAENLWSVLLHEANSQKPLSTSQYAILCEVGHLLGISLESIQYLAPKGESSKKQRAGKKEEPKARASDNYQMLGIPATATAAEVKWAYRKLMSRYHPDRLMSKDLPDEFLELATRRTQEIKAAYEKICKEKGI